MTLTTTIEVDEIDTEVTVEFKYIQGEPMSRDMEYGGCAPDIEFMSEFKDHAGSIHYPTEKEIGRITDECFEMVADLRYERGLW